MVNTEIVNSSVTQPGDLEERKRGPEPTWRVLDNPHGASKIINSKLSPHRALPPRHHPCSSLSISTRLKHPGEALNGSLGVGVSPRPSNPERV